MTRFEIKYEIIANDPSEMKLRLGTLKDITLISMDKTTKHAILSVTVESNDIDNALDEAESKINNFLDFQTLFFVEDMEIIGFFRFPIAVTDLDRNSSVNIPGVTVDTIVLDNDAKLTEVLNEYVNLVNEKKNIYLKTALSFFRSARIHNNRPTNIIELFAVLEAIFSKDEERTEMKYRISNRVATLMGRDENERKNILTKMRRLYDLRSTIVHGSIVKKLDYEDLFSITRQSLLRFLDLARIYDDHNVIVDTLDESILENKVRIKLQTESNKLLALSTIKLDTKFSQRFP